MFFLFECQQEKAMFVIKPVLEKAVREAHTNLNPQTMVVTDLGCSSGPNTLHFVSEEKDAITRHCNDLNQRHEQVQLQFILNDLPGNDFNNLFRLVEQFKESKAKTHMGEPLPPCYISGLPGSYYTRLFPCRTVHLFHSLFCLQWRSQAPEGLEGTNKTSQDEGDIYITQTSSSSVVKLYQEQFKKDFSLFLRLRYEELVFGGQMVLTFIGRKNEDVLSGDSNHHLYGLLAQSLQSLVDEVRKIAQSQYRIGIWGSLQKCTVPLLSPKANMIDKLVHDRAFYRKRNLNLSMYRFIRLRWGEVEDVVKQSGLFDINHLQLFEVNWDPYDDDSESTVLHDSVQSGVNVSKCFRAVMESLVASHFQAGDAILDMLFAEYANRVTKHLAVEKTKHAIVVVSLKKAF
ncbi:hypothetical protein PR202_ga17591 [Eleusine coracana subsp. coracana]|uniref:Uncharacterized protein n=1 Tax=Eleusine coracana subsp. coracana TaxID=191504 RepID=A0AAV5CNX1_ELECO|nr:hypothetical protein PR202_ga17344 [Eleusine coracana subsp. coracana]GJN00410.1 hypothetical protein PR202_ga17591 [Eleusine coracana subsp. coracana]